MNVVVVRSGRVYVLGTLLSLGDYLTQIADDTFISKCRFVCFVVLCSFEPFCFGSRVGVLLTMYQDDDEKDDGGGGMMRWMRTA